MIFSKKKKPDMIDVRTLQKRGVVKIPKSEIQIPTDDSGFVELSQTKNQSTNQKSETNANFFNFMPTPSPEEPEKFSTTSNGYNKREVDTKITELDNKIYKLEQRLELLERKLNINQSPSPVGPMGW